MASTRTFVSNGGFLVSRDPSFNPEAVDTASLAHLQAEAVRHVAHGNNVLIHGPAGTGKSVTVRRIQRMLARQKKQFATCAYTGPAAVNINGSTIHGLFRGLGLMNGDAIALAKKMKRKPELLVKLRNLKVIIIDEISFVHGAFFDKMDFLLRSATSIDLPFGGKQVVLTGDFYQLSPMADDEGNEVYAFDSKSWPKLKLVHIELTEVFRSAGSDFLNLQHRVRVGKLDIDCMVSLVARVNAAFPDDGIKPTSLFATNRAADTLNEVELKKLPGKIYKYDGDCVVQPVKGAKDHEVKDLHRQSQDVLKHSRVPETLRVKLNSQVMLRFNIDVAGMLVNGSRGVVVGFTDDQYEHPVVSFICGTTRVIRPLGFESKYPTGTITFTQVPLILAWGMTIHKSQGATLDRVSLSTNGIFAPGMMYVGLSRVRTLDCLQLLDFNPRAIIVSKRVLERFPVIPPTPQVVTTEEKCDEGTIVTPPPTPPPTPTQSPQRKRRSSTRLASKRKYAKLQLSPV